MKDKKLRNAVLCFARFSWIMMLIMILILIFVISATYNNIGLNVMILYVIMIFIGTASFIFIDFIKRMIRLKRGL